MTKQSPCVGQPGEGLRVLAILDERLFKELDRLCQTPSVRWFM